MDIESQTGNAPLRRLTLASPGETVARWQQIAQQGNVLLHGSPSPDLTVLEPFLSSKATGEPRCLYATPSLVFAVARGLQKLLGSRHAVMAWEYHWRGRAARVYTCLSVRRDLVTRWRELEANVYVCAAAAFSLIAGQTTPHGTRWSLGLLRSPAEWGAVEPVMPLAMLRIPLSALPCRICWHHPGDSHMRVLALSLTRARVLARRHSACCGIEQL